MKIYLLTFILIILTFSVYSQSRCNCEAIIDWQYGGQVYIYDMPNGQVNDSIANDSINGDFLIVRITDIQKDYFKVTLQSSFAETQKRGWIKKANYIGIYARNYSDDVKLELYSQPDKTSKVESIVNEWIQNLYVIVDCKDYWVKVKMTSNNKRYTGWLEKEMQCANPYTTCN
jgi:SH3-like domain-containing protein